MTKTQIKVALRQAVPARAEYGTVKVPSRLELIRRIAQYLGLSLGPRGVLKEV